MRSVRSQHKSDHEDGWGHPGEVRSTSGLFSGDDGRLVYVDRSGAFRDYTYPLSGFTGVTRSRLGIRTDDGVSWLDHLETAAQYYHDQSTVVVTEHEGEAVSVTQYDVTIDDAHVTHVEVHGDLPQNASLVVGMRFAPDGSSSAGRLVHDDVVEVFHDREHDYVTASTGLTRTASQAPDRFEELLAGASEAFPRDAEDAPNDPLTDTILLEAPLAHEGDVAQTSLVSLIADHAETTREDALARVRAVVDHYPTDSRIRTVAERSHRISVPSVPHKDAVVDDLRVLDLLSADTGARIKGPECDPHFLYSGGYGYTWFRDDARVATHLLRADDRLELDAADSHRKTATFYCETQSADGTWPHRVWARNGRLAPGWANARLEGTGAHYQADQTARAVSFLATYLRVGSPGPDLAARVEATIEDALEALDEMLARDGLPEPCQNLWESLEGRFTHTAATFLDAFAAVGRAPVAPGLQDRASDYAAEVSEALHLLWDADRDVFVRRLVGDGLDSTLDVSTLALVDAHRQYAALNGGLDDRRLDRLERHVGTTLAGLYREGEGDVAGLIRFEGDDWRLDGQDESKLWTQATAWGANAAADLAALFDRHDHAAERDFEAEAIDLLELLLPGGPLPGESGYLSEQVFDDGTQDSATPIARSHALRLATVVHLSETGALSTPVGDRPTVPSREPTWTTGEKYAVGTTADHGAEDPTRVWFTLTEGAMTEARFPRIDLLNLRTLDFLVVDSDPESDYAARTHNETRTDDDASTIERTTRPADTDALVYEQTVEETAGDHRWTVEVEYVVDTDHDAVVLDVAFSSADDKAYDVFAVADCALNHSGRYDSAERVETDRGYALAARDETPDDVDHVVVDEDGERYQIAAGLRSARGFEWATVGAGGDEHLHGVFVGDSELADSAAAGPDNVVLVGQVASEAASVADTLALGFAEDGDADTALAEAGGALDRGFIRARDDYVAGWHDYLTDRELPASVRTDPDLVNQYKAALMVLKAVEDKTFDGAGIASPSVPWGDGVVAEEPRDYGYNFVWARDAYQVFTALAAAGDVESARDTLEYIYRYQQREDGFIAQNTYLDGRTRWGGEQMDNIAFPSVMAYQLAERHGVDFETADYDYGNLRAGAEYVVRNGPDSGQERWEEEGGFSPSTIAAEIAALVSAAKLAHDAGHHEDAAVYLATADRWREGVHEWCATTTGTETYDRTPYYFRISRSGKPDRPVKRQLANNGPTLDERDVIDAGFLELVRLGIYPADDETIENSVAVVDDTIRVDTPQGPAWYRYNGDGYGELGERSHDEGAPWGVGALGAGRLWPIFTGERAEYELLRGTADGDLAPDELLATMERFANDGRMIPEQIWDREYGTRYNWDVGDGTGAATPLAWSMAQFVRLAHSIDAGTPVETPQVVDERYGREGPPAGPDLSVSFPDEEVAAAEYEVTGATTAESVVVWTPEETWRVPVADGHFAATVPLDHGRNQIAVAATAGDAFETLGTAVERGEVFRDG